MGSLDIPPLSPQLLVPARGDVGGPATPEQDTSKPLFNRILGDSPHDAEAITVLADFGGQTPLQLLQ